MKIGDYITAEDWNALGAEKQHALQASLRFMGYRVSDEWFPIAEISSGNPRWGVFLYEDGDLVNGPIRERHNRISLEEVLSFIELASFEVKQ